MRQLSNEDVTGVTRAFLVEMLIIVTKNCPASTSVALTQYR